MSDKSKALQVAEFLEASKNEALEMLGADYPMPKITIEGRMNALINNLKFLGGAAQSAAVKHSPDEQFPPITNFMGEEVELPKAVAEEEITPQETAKQQFLQKVEDFEVNIHTLDNAKILEDYTTKQDVSTIRGAAKRAGLTDFKSAEINGAFLDAIRNAIVSNANEAAAKAATNESLEGKN